MISAGCSRYWYTTSEMSRRGVCKLEMEYLLPHIIRQPHVHTDDGNGCSRQTVCTLTFHHRNAIAASHRLAFHRATCKAGRGGLAVRALVVCGWQSIIEKHPSADRCFIGKAPPTVEPRYIRATMIMEKQHEISRPSDLTNMTL